MLINLRYWNNKKCIESDEVVVVVEEEAKGPGLYILLLLLYIRLRLYFHFLWRSLPSERERPSKVK